MKIAIVADSHFDEHSRFDECVELHDWIAEDCLERGANLLLHAGDIFERRSTPMERIKVAEWVRFVARRIPVVIVRGNHDQVDEHELWTMLGTAESVHIEQAASVVVVAGVAIGCMAWPRKAFLDASGADQRTTLQSVLRGLGQQMAEHDGPRVLLAHAMVRGSQTSTGQELIWCELELGLEDLALAGADLYALGHIHAHQHFDVNGAPAIYPGSPRRANFGELESKGYVIAEFDQSVCGCSHGWARGNCPMCRNRGSLSWEFIETPATPMHHVDDEWGEFDGSMGWLAGAHGLPRSCAGCELRFRYRVAAEHREPARAAAMKWRDEWLAEGAVSVKLEEVVIATTRARVPEVARAATLPEKLHALWASRGDVPEPDRAEALIAKLATLEEVA